MNILGISGQAGSGKDTASDYFVEHYGFVKMSLADPIKRLSANVFAFSYDQLWGPSDLRNKIDERFSRCEIVSSSVAFGPGCSLAPIDRVCDQAWATAARNLLVYGPKWVESVLPDASEDDRVECLQGLCTGIATLGHKYPDLSPRVLLQYLGSDWGRTHLGDDIWIDLLLRDAVPVLEGHDYQCSSGVVFLKDLYTKPRGVVCSDVRFLNEITKFKQNKCKLLRVNRSETDSKAAVLGMSSHVSEMEQKGFTTVMFDAVINNDKSLADLKSALDTTLVSFGY